MGLRHLFSRFDSHLMSAPTPAPAPVPAPAPKGEAGDGAADRQPGATPSLAAEWRAWCEQGAGDAALQAWQPWARRRPALPWAQQACAADAGPGLLDLAEDLDGSLRLQACRGRLQRLALRVRVKLSDACWWRARRVGDIWDAGQLIDGPDLAERARRFEPRRATLILALDIEPARLQAAAAALAARSADFDYPVRLIRLDADTAMVGPSGSRLRSRKAPNNHERMPISKV